ncbi:GNAT family N-acetyltransferase [Arcanobacterium pinnipediorum]|uniref:GNAT family N-acetyltransferase n=1 Tax=Arcanobacterium pinnipediorum TaxID=1503041 RepID=A0ABY5AGU7_9ACTO|nr:GNAT family N-acetyltransferase [Arcanobacterium pinnipediorum]USR79428.1 GNAT family N-acetyltransferase [Arcanobacterium pinnipediorum]
MLDIYFETLTALTDDQLREDILALWQHNSELGASVGAQPGAPRSRYEELLAGHEESMAANRGWLYVMREKQTDKLLGFAWWIIGIPEGNPNHIATIKRFQVDPNYQGQGLGRKFMDYIHSGEVLDQLGEQVDFLHLQFRAGRGLGKFYASYGYEVNVRWDLIRRNDDGEYDGWLEMMRRRDGGPLPGLRL